MLAGAVLFSAIAYRRTARKDPGLTTEFALLVTVLLGALTMQNPLLGTGMSVATTILLASRGRLHRAVKNLLSEQEAHDALVFLAATLVILPLAPNRDLGPFGVINPRKIWELVVLVMAVGRRVISRCGCSELAWDWLWLGLWAGSFLPAPPSDR